MMITVSFLLFSDIHLVDELLVRVIKPWNQEPHLMQCSRALYINDLLGKGKVGHQ